MAPSGVNTNCPLRMVAGKSLPVLSSTARMRPSGGAPSYGNARGGYRLIHEPASNVMTRPSRALSAETLMATQSKTARLVQRRIIELLIKKSPTAASYYTAHPPGRPNQPCPGKKNDRRPRRSSDAKCGINTGKREETRPPNIRRYFSRPKIYGITGALPYA